ncbi:MAG TPA: CoA transferase [Pseudolysinimonas sp.]|jgi:crotonobetainyl-CoA:carnitine CoA-transferase CaiB-like acyl-CoA transferase
MMTARALDGVKIVDLSRWIAGPYCTMLLADLGADVIRVERPGGEDARHLAPFVGNESAYFLHYNRNKRAMTLDTRHDSSIEVLRRLLAWADVVVQNYRPGTMASMGLGEEELASLNPRLIHTAISGYGQSGPWSTRPLFNAVAEAGSGLMALNGDRGVPMMTGNFSADHAAGLHAAYGTLAALFEREHSGRGQLVDVALFDSALSIVGFPWTAALNGVAGSSDSVRQQPNRDATAAPGNLFPTGDDRWVYIDAGTDGLWRALVSAVGTERIADVRFATVERRNELVDDVEAAIIEWTTMLTADEVSSRLAAAGVPSGAVFTLADAATQPIVAERELASAQAGSPTIPGPPVKLSRTPGDVRRRPPAVGADTEELLREVCGFDDRAIAALRADGAV